MQNETKKKNVRRSDRAFITEVYDLRHDNDLLRSEVEKLKNDFNSLKNQKEDPMSELLKALRTMKKIAGNAKQQYLDDKKERGIKEIARDTITSFGDEGYFAPIRVLDTMIFTVDYLVKLHYEGKKASLDSAGLTGNMTTNNDLYEANEYLTANIQRAHGITVLSIVFSEFVYFLNRALHKPNKDSSLDTTKYLQDSLNK